jgi:monomeric sarcosine oxidase
MSKRQAEVIVLGGGTMGTATGWALARQGVNVVVLEQFQHVHSNGSHGGKHRIFRHAYAEGALYVPWTLEADRLWSELEERTGASILNRIGCIDISAPGYHRARDAYNSATTHGVEAEWLTGADVNVRWPIWTLPDDREVCYGPQAGYLNVANALNALASEFSAAGGLLLDNTPVTSWSASDSGVEVVTESGSWSADRLVISAGAWSIHLLRDLGIPLEVRRKPVMWFEVDADHAALARPDAMPVFISDDEHGEFYGIPEEDFPAVKVGIHSGGESVDPNTIRRTVDSADSDQDVLPFIRRSLRGFTGQVLDTSVCMYTVTPDEDFVIDRHPEWSRVTIAAGFSGHGFKFTPKVGEYLAELTTSETAWPIPEFALARFAGVAGKA